MCPPTPLIRLWARSCPARSRPWTFSARNSSRASGLSSKIVTGYPAEEIIKLAESENVDLIVMGTHGRSGIDRILFGSVAEKVVKNASKPVLTIHPES